MNFRKFMKQVQGYSTQLQSVQQEMTNATYAGKAGGGMVKITINGHGHLNKITIDPSIIKAEDQEILEDLILVAYNDAKSQLPNPGTEQMPDNFSNLFGK